MASPLDELCQALNATHPGSILTLRYSTDPTGDRVTRGVLGGFPA